MKRFGVWVVLMAFLVTMIPAVFAQEEGNEDEKNIKQNVKENEKVTKSKRRNRKNLPKIVYNPPKLGMPGNRTGGGARSKGGDLPTVIAIVPNHMAASMDPQPNVVWFLSKPTNYTVEVVINDRNRIDPIYRETIDCSKSQGIMVTKLNELKVNLVPGKDYDWSIAVVPDMENRSRDITATGVIKCVAPGHNILKKITSADSFEAPSIYASEGFWYDSMTHLNRLIEENPEDNELREYRVEMIRQIGIFDEQEFKKLNIKEVDGVKLQ